MHQCTDAKAISIRNDGTLKHTSYLYRSAEVSGGGPRFDIQVLIFLGNHGEPKRNGEWNAEDGSQRLGWTG